MTVELSDPLEIIKNVLRQDKNTNSLSGLRSIRSVGGTSEARVLETVKAMVPKKRFLQQSGSLAESVSRSMAAAVTTNRLGQPITAVPHQIGSPPPRVQVLNNNYSNPLVDEQQVEVSPRRVQFDTFDETVLDVPPSEEIRVLKNHLSVERKPQRLRTPSPGPGDGFGSEGGSPRELIDVQNSKVDRLLRGGGIDPEIASVLKSQNELLEKVLSASSGAESVPFSHTSSPFLTQTMGCPVTVPPSVCMPTVRQTPYVAAPVLQSDTRIAKKKIITPISTPANAPVVRASSTVQQSRKKFPKASVPVSTGRPGAPRIWEHHPAHVYIIQLFEVRGLFTGNYSSDMLPFLNNLDLLQGLDMLNEGSYFVYFRKGVAKERLFSIRGYPTKGRKVEPFFQWGDASGKNVREKLSLLELKSISTGPSNPGFSRNLLSTGAVRGPEIKSGHYVNLNPSGCFTLHFSSCDISMCATTPKSFSSACAVFSSIIRINDHCSNIISTNPPAIVPW